jgi:hypothetical protein
MSNTKFFFNNFLIKYTLNSFQHIHDLTQINFRNPISYPYNLKQQKYFYFYVFLTFKITFYGFSISEDSSEQEKKIDAYIFFE